MNNNAGDLSPIKNTNMNFLKFISFGRGSCKPLSPSNLLVSTSHESKFIGGVLAKMENDELKKQKLRQILLDIPFNSAITVEDAFEIIHDCLVPFDELEEVSEIIKTEANKGTIKEIIKIEVVSYLSCLAVSPITLRF